MADSGIDDILGKYAPASPPADSGGIDDILGKFGAASPPPKKEEGSWVPKAISEMHTEGSKDFGKAWEGVTQEGLKPSVVGKRLLEGPSGQWEQFKDVGSALGSAVALPFSYFTGAARSLVGHPMAAAGEKIDQLVSSSPRTEQQIFEEMGPGIDTALGAVARKPRSLTDLQGPGLTNFPPMAPREQAAPMGSLFTKAGQEQRAGHALREVAEDPEALMRSLDNPPADIVPGSKPTTFQQTGDLGIGQLEMAAGTRRSAEFTRLRGEQNAARVSALENVQRTGSPEDVGEFLRAEFRHSNERVDGAVQAAERNALEEARRLGGEQDPQLLGNRARHELQVAEDAARAEERVLWDAVDPNGELVARTGPVRAAHNRVYGELGAADRTTLSPKEIQLSEVMGGYGPSIPFREMTGLRGAVSAALREELRTNGRTPAYNRLSQFRGAIEEAIVRDVMDINQGAFVQDAAERLRVASEATRRRATTFNNPQIKKIIRRDGLAAEYQMGSSSVPGHIFGHGPGAYDKTTAFIRAAGQDNALPILRDAAAADMRRYAVGRDGRIDPERLNRWRNSRADSLRAIDEIDDGAFSQRIAQADRAEGLIADAAATRAQVLERFETSAVAKLLDMNDAKDVSRALGGIFTGERSVGRAKEVARAIERSPEAKEGARRGIVEYIQERFMSNTEAGTSEQNLIRADQFQEFVKRNRESLLQFFDPPQLATWEAIVADIRRANRSVVATKLPGRSNTPQDIYSLKMGPQNYSVLHRIMAYAAGALAAGATIPAGGFMGHLAGVLGASYVISLRDAGVVKAQDAIRRAMLDPAFARDLLQRASPRAKMRGAKRYSMYQASSANSGDDE